MAIFTIKNRLPMLLRPLLFANLRQLAGSDHLEVEMPDRSTAGDLIRHLAQQFPEFQSALKVCRVALNREFVDHDHLISAEMEIALIPPVSGGHDGPKPSDKNCELLVDPSSRKRNGDELESEFNPDLENPGPENLSNGPSLRLQGQEQDQIGSFSRLTHSPLVLAEVHTEVEHPHAGGVTSFVGNVRAFSRGRSIRHLDYESYGLMAIQTMDRIAQDIESELPGSRVRIHHRLGRLMIGEAAVMIAASAPHREEAFQACRRAIERLKSDVPIWKYEVDQQGGTWVGTGP